MSKLHGITLHRPWAWAIAHSTKRVENRTWKPTIAVGSYLAIHAGKTWDEDAANNIAAEIDPKCPLKAEEHPMGIVAVARLARVIDCSREDVPEDQAQWTVGPHAWLLDNVTALRSPIECRGAQGLWVIEEGLLARVREAWGAARADSDDALRRPDAGDGKTRRREAAGE
jgi:hypothetical protein